ncbi:MAG: TIGR02099 family protein, partial [Alkalimonas sp.]|nr:TIGR02099 family protein [Alkalimonas sp.]
MQKVGRVCFYCLHKLWLLLAIALVLLAALVSILRYSLPYADNYKGQIESFLAHHYGTEVTIGTLSAEWRARGPALLLQDLEFSSEAQQLGFSIQQASVHIHFWRSLRSLQLRSSHVELSGVDFRLEAERLTRAPTADQQQEPLLNALEQLFFHQLQQFSITNSQLQLNQQHGQPLLLDIKRLDWRNQGNRHQGQGQLSVQGVTGNSLSFVLDLYGNQLKTTFGQLYLQSEALDVQPWLSQFLPELAELERASVNLQAWGRVEQGALQRIQLDLANNTLAWQQDNTTKWLQLQDGQLLWYPTAEGWSLYSSDLMLENGDSSYPAMNLQLHRQQSRTSGAISQLELGSLHEIMALLAEQRPQLQALTQAELTGVLPKLSWSVDSSGWQLHTEIQQLGSSPFDDWPGVQGLNGSLMAADGFAELTLNGHDNALSWAGAFSNDTQYQQMQASIQLVKQQDIWQLGIPQLSLHGDEIQAEAEMLLRLTAEPELFLLATADGVAVPNAMHFYPRHYMPATVIDYLSDSLLAGQVKQAATLWHGPLTDFPYRHKEGVFQSQGRVTDGRMAFAPDWPQLSNIVADLWFENSQMRISSSQAQLLDLAITDEVVVRIDDLFAADHLLIDIDTEADAADVTALMLQSPLAGSVGNALEYTGLIGPVSGQVNLQVGLRSAEVQASGKAQFEGARANIRAPDMLLEHIKGELRFANDQIEATQLEAEWRGLPFTLELAGKQADSEYQVDLQLAGQPSMPAVLQQLPFSIKDLAAGETDWQLALAIQLPGDGFRYQAQLQADLTAATLRLPAPYTKSAGQASALEVWVDGNTERSIIRAAYSEPLYFQARL